MKKAPPSKIKILHLDWDVMVAPCRYCDVAKAWAWCDFERQRIYYDMRASQQQLREYVFHEIQHALNHSLELSNASDEAIARRGSVGWLTVFKDNPKLVEWMFKNVLKKKK
jgi:hypothetical protein